MLIRELTIHNFGIYGGTHSFNLNPSPHQDDRNLILFIGKNGVGKTTFVEALKLSIWGTLAVNDKLSQNDYEKYLSSKFHRTKKTSQPAGEASISILFDYVQLGNTNQYLIERRWVKSSNGVNEHLTIIENENELDELTNKEKELYLRDLFPPGYKDLFFFDGEKLNMFSQKESTGILSHSIQSLLGLDTVEQLQKDISYYLREESDNHKLSELAKQFEETEERINFLDKQQFEIRERITSLSNEKDGIAQDLIPKTEQEITKHGRWDKEKLIELKTNKSKLEEKIEQLQKQLIDQCNGLLPFATTPRYLSTLNEQLIKEKEFRFWSNSKEVLNKQKSLLNEIDFKQSLEKATKDTDSLENILNEVKTQITKALPEQPLNEDEVTHNFSSQDHSEIESWINSALSVVPKTFAKVAKELAHAKDQFNNLESNLSWTADENIAKPLFEDLAKYNKRIGEIESQIDTLIKEQQEVRGLIEFHSQRRSKVQEKMDNESILSEKLQLARDTNNLLKDYSEKLKEEKLQDLGQLITKKFSLLCRKEALFDGVVVAPNDFSITLKKHDKEFNKSSLSAGEKQLLSLSILWALYDISGLPAPIIIDTPLSRLDSVHRARLTKYFFSKASQQMLVLGTDDEIDQMITKDLSDYVSHLYEMSFDSGTGSTVQTKYDSEHISQYLTPLVEA